MKMKILFSTIAIIFIIFVHLPMCFAYEENPNPEIPSKPTGDSSLGDILSSAEGFVSEGAAQEGVQEKTDETHPFSITLTNILITIGTVLAVIYASVLGIKFMIGAAEEKAEVKESLIPFVIGCAIVYGGFAIWSIMVNIGRSL